MQTVTFLGGGLRGCLFLRNLPEGQLPNNYIAKRNLSS